MKIFIIDDEEVSLFISKRILTLSEQTADIHVFLFAEKALNFIDKDIPDVILLDLNMPIMNGWEFLDALAPNWVNLMNKCRIYILTSSLDYLDEIKAKEHPMISGLMHKPLSSESVNLIYSQKEYL